MASKNNNKSNNKKPAQSPADQRQSTEISNVNLHAAQNGSIPIVGIGASAGGLQALQAFFEALPENTGMAFVVITHLHPEHESHLAELLQARTDMPVRQVTGPMAVEEDHVYVIPPNRGLIMEDGKVDTAEFTEPRGQRAPVDHFFRSLARAHPNAVGIILSGGGTDGAVGVKSIKEEGGLLMVQHPQEAEHDSMPRAAINTGLADVVLPVKELAKKLVEYSRQRPALPLDPSVWTPVSCVRGSWKPCVESLPRCMHAQDMISASTSVPRFCAASSDACRSTDSPRWKTIWIIFVKTQPSPRHCSTIC
jgi:chemotaxis response regulator CheB